MSARQLGPDARALVFVDGQNLYKGCAERKGITYAVWRDAGVPADVLKRAGIKRAR